MWGRPFYVLVTREGLIKLIAVIPARMAASRFSGKPLAKILNLPKVEHVRRRARLCAPLDEVVVATRV